MDQTDAHRYNKYYSSVITQLWNLMAVDVPNDEETINEVMPRISTVGMGWVNKASSERINV